MPSGRKVPSLFSLQPASAQMQPLSSYGLSQALLKLRAQKKIRTQGHQTGRRIKPKYMYQQQSHGRVKTYWNGKTHFIQDFHWQSFSDTSR